ncbi:MAG: hypothetical protein ACK4F9_05710 [Brevinematia bacterium]
MSIISETINQILKVDQELSKKLESAKIEARKIIESAKIEIEEYGNKKSKEFEKFKEELDNKLKKEISEFRKTIDSKAEAIRSSILEISRSKNKEVVQEIASNVFKEIIGTLLSK